MRIEAGTVAFWRDLFPGSDKYVFLLGTFHDAGRSCECVAYFTISSQTKWATVERTRREMVAVPRGTLDCLDAPTSYIQCWWTLGVETIESFRAKETEGMIMYRGELPQYVEPVRKVVADSDVLSQSDIDCALAALPRSPPAAVP